MTKTWMLAAVLAAMVTAPLGVVSAMAVEESDLETAPVEEVIGECDQMIEENEQSCGYDVGDNGLYGCSVDGNGNADVCFFCPADGSRQCYLFLTGHIPTKFRHEFAGLKLDLTPFLGGPQPDPPGFDSLAESGVGNGVAVKQPNATSLY